MQQNYELVKSLSGHSGCTVDLCKMADNFFIRKTAGVAGYNKRLKKQYIKQLKFELSGVSVPKIYNHGSISDVFYFDMEFVDGITLAEYMHKIKVKEIVDLMTVLFKALESCKTEICPKAKEIFRKKIASLRQTIDVKNSIADKALSVLEKFDFGAIPMSACCGDLTLENIILSSCGKIYLIDLLDSFYNSWLIDVAKILQDIDLGWSYRHIARDYNLNLRLEIAKQALLENILAMPNGRVVLRQIYHLLLLNILRIYPYAKDEDTLNFLNSSCLKIIDTINKMEN